MKVLLFTHKADIDGMGSAVLAKLAFSNLEIVFCEAYSITDDIMRFYQSKKIYEYDQIYITDLCPNIPFIEIIDNDPTLKKSVQIYDHHVSSIIEGKEYSFLHVNVKNDLGLCCGTSLFYQHLLDNKYLQSTSRIDHFVELTRRRDTWEWKTIYHDEEANDLCILHSITGNNAYIEGMYQKLLSNEQFSFSETEKSLILNKRELTIIMVEELVKMINYQNIINYNVGIIFIPYEYRSPVLEYLRDHHYDMDVVMMIALDHKTISYRSMNKAGSALKLAEYFGGKGHEEAAGSQINNELLAKIIDVITTI